jgi:hypothetical protein
MSNPGAPKLKFADWLKKLTRIWRPEPISLGRLSPPPQPMRAKLGTSVALPGNFYFFECFLMLKIGEASYLCYPKQAIFDVGTKPPTLRWATPMKLCLPDPAIPRMTWIDDTKRGLSQRALTCPEDVLGTEGTIGKNRFVFEKILQKTKNQIVYSLFRPDNQTRMAYALPVDIFVIGKASTQTAN